MNYRSGLISDTAVLVILLAAVLHLPSIPAFAGSTDGSTQILYQDTAADSCLKYIERAPREGIDGGDALKLVPDKWHQPSYRLYCADGARRDFRAYDVIEFYFRSPNADPGNPTFYVRTWDKLGNSVSVRDYIDSGVIDNSWRVVSIPLAHLTTEDWDLGNVETLVWNKDSEGRFYYVDQITLRQTTPPVLNTSGETAPFPESDTVLRLTFSKQYNESTVRNLSNYALQSSTDPNYALPLSPVDSGMQYQVHGFSSSKTPEILYQLFLKFPESMQNGHSYTLYVQGISDNSGNLMTPAHYAFTYDDRSTVNPNVKVNQVGYLPDGPKVGYVGGYLGDLGGGAWAVGEQGGLFVWDDQQGWHQVDPLVDMTLRAVAAAREDDVWCVGDAGTILHWDGGDWTRYTSPTGMNLYATCAGPTNIGWAVGENGTILRSENRHWTPTPSPSTMTLRGVWAGVGDVAWTVGDAGTILKWEDGQWVTDEHVTDVDLYAIHGPNEDWLWAVGEHGTVLVRQYGHWKVYQETPGTTGTLRALTTDLAGQVWIGGDGGLLWHKDGFGGSAFSEQHSGTEKSICGLARQHGRRFFAVGQGGTLMGSSGSGWKVEGTLGQSALFGVFALPYGAMRLPESALHAIIMNSGREEIQTVPLQLEAANWQLSGEDVFSFDFSALTTPGTYQAYVPGIGLSLPFDIGRETLHHAAYTTARGLYYQRCGTALTTPYAENTFVRPMEHGFDVNGQKVDAAFHSSLLDSALYSGELPGDLIDAHGGWHDAGDFGKYVPTAAAALWYLFTAYDLDAARFKDSAWNIPESGNGVPDLLDEARWEVDWLTRMQATDGGIYHKLTSESWFEGMPQDEPAPRYIFAKTTHDTALGAAIFAAAARLWSPFDAALAENYLQRAELAWNYLQTHSVPVPETGFQNPSGTVTGEYCDSGDADNRLWAAAELYRTTGKSEYRQYFESWWSNNEHEWGWNTWQHFFPCAYWAYLRAGRPDDDEVIKTEIRDHMIRDADQEIQRTIENPYKNAARLDVPSWIGWGAFTQSSEYAFPLLQAWALTGDSKYRKAALVNLDTQLGANPLSVSFITGLGGRSPEDPLHMVSIYDGVTTPLPGIPVFGAAAHLSNDNSYNAASQSAENNYPCSNEVTDPYPILRRYIDAHELVPMSEFTIVDMAISAGVFGLLAN